MVLGALGCSNNADFKKNSKFQHCANVFIICQKLRHVRVIKKNTVLVLIDLQSNPPKRSQFAVGTLF